MGKRSHRRSGTRSPRTPRRFWRGPASNRPWRRSWLPEKDADGVHPYNMGRLVEGTPIFEACTPRGVIKMIESTGVAIAGKRAVVLGRSNIVGKPVALMLLHRHATVTICHSKTKDL